MWLAGRMYCAMRNHIIMSYGYMDCSAKHETSGQTWRFISTRNLRSPAGRHLHQVVAARRATTTPRIGLRLDHQSTEPPVLFFESAHLS